MSLSITVDGRAVIPEQGSVRIDRGANRLSTARFDVWSSPGAAMDGCLAIDDDDPAGYIAIDDDNPPGCLAIDLGAPDHPLIRTGHKVVISVSNTPILTGFVTGVHEEAKERHTHKKFQVRCVDAGDALSGQLLPSGLLVTDGTPLNTAITNLLAAASPAITSPMNGSADTTTLPEIEIARYVSIADALSKLCETAGTTWRISGAGDILTANLSDTPASNYAVTADRATTVARSIDPSEVWNRVHYTGGGDNPTTYIAEDHHSQVDYGLRVTHKVDPEVVTPDAVKAAAEEWIKRHREPRQTLTVSITDPEGAATKVEIGTVLTVNLPTSYEIYNENWQVIGQTLDHHVEASGELWDVGLTLSRYAYLDRWVNNWKNLTAL